MKAMVLTGRNRIEIVEKPVPEMVRPDEVLIRMKSVGVCGSDIHYYREGRIGRQAVQYPFTIGHEGSGIVEEVAGGVTRVKPGDRVAIDPAMPCYRCDQCRAGRYHTCRNLKFLGCPGQSEGCLQEYVVMPEESCYRLPDNVTFDQATLSEPLSIGVYAVDLSVPMKGARIGILGSGPIGISVLLPSLAQGADKLYVTDKIDERLRIAAEMGAHWTGNPDKQNVVNDILEHEPLQLDAVFECCGKQEAVDQAVKLLKPGGKLMIIGIPSFSRWSFDVDDLREAVEKTLHLISSGELRPDRMQTHYFSYAEVAEAFELYFLL